jgi:hypothetical protein
MVTECMADTCPYLWTLRERLGKVIECENCSYLFARPLAFHQGISVRPRVLFIPTGLFPTTMAGKSQIFPADTWAHSSVTERRLEELVRDRLLRPRASRTQPEWRVPPSDH